MAAAPVYSVTPNTGDTTLANSDGTAAKTFYTAGSSGSRVNRISVYSGPTTAPGGTTKVIISLGTTIIDIFSMVNTVDTFQYDRTFADLLLTGSETLTITSRTALTSGATLHVTGFGADL